jgi:hypothetical protein
MCNNFHSNINQGIDILIYTSYLRLKLKPMKKFITLLILLSFFNYSFSQIDAYTLDGKKVSLNEDGTWKYVDNSIKEKQKKVGCEYTIFETNKIFLKRQQIGKTGTYKLTGFLAMHGDSTLFHCNYTGDLGHVDKYAYAVVRFEDNSTVELKGLDRKDYRTPPVFIASINDPYIFTTKKVVKIKLVLSENFADIILSDREFFIKSLDCLE